MRTVIAVQGEFMGRGNEKVGKRLTASFLRKLVMVDPKPEAIVFLNTAVYLLTPRSNALDELTQLQDAGVDLLACGTCVGFFKVEDELQLGEISNMLEIATLFAQADKVITI
jgi:selenium metabolism protein YedF